jgi:hypothetical protein
MTNTYKIILFIVLIFTHLSCDKNLQDNYIAMVENVPISEYEFTMRYNFNPHLVQYHNEYEAKKVLLSAIIAEKLLSLESQKASQLSEDIKIKINQHKKEAIIEQFRRDQIENQVEITDLELKKEYSKSIREVDIKYISFKSLDDAKNVKQEIAKGKSFKSAVRNYMNLHGWNKEPIPEKTVIWNSEIHDFEDIILNLSTGEISDPIKINGDYYLIKSKKTRIKKHQGDSDYTSRLPALKDRVLKKKIKDKYVEFYNSNIRPLLGNVDWKKLSYAFELVIQDVSFNQQSSQSHPFSDKKALSDEIYLNYKAQQSQLRDMIVIHFPDQTNWNFEELMLNLKYGPFPFNYKNKTLFKKSFKQNILLALEYEAIYQLAKQAGYQNNNQVLKDTKIWDSYYQANDYRHHLLKATESITLSRDSSSENQSRDLQKFRLDYFDDYLCSLSKKYPIKINNKKFNSVELNKSDMVVMKTHFAHRLVVPLTEPLDGLPQWRNIINSIFKKSGITMLDNTAI